MTMTSVSRLRHKNVMPDFLGIQDGIRDGMSNKKSLILALPKRLARK